ncbi:tetratricopeptide repeat protein [Marinobacter sp. 2_MG-2023]|uniref:tetratricopeptide repeat protein n=1 Tax=Marinobacter sp. 2_MG-2023 TaxID=3062679 RepID=UPI0026E24ADD|nr:hypothetical protein [Marinobacter sp. 2_MG-2023]MDO6442834.1 hypothetical protein [Marinobacter sp. 2_MG-2023]
MYRLFVIMMSAVLLGGCGNLKTAEVLSRTGDALVKIGQKTPASGLDQEVRPLFEQPYIDPLTEYLRRHEGDSTKTAQLDQVRQERERRCAAVALRYNKDEISETGLALYRRGYGFSCPQDVAAYEARLEAMQHPPKSVQKAVSANPGASDLEGVGSGAHDDATAEPELKAETVTESRELNDCYLLTRIRNFSGALEACRGPAEAGVAGAQASMAQIHSALGHHEQAYQWAIQAATESGQAAYLLGEMYAHGHGVAQDKAAAIKWFKVAAELGQAEAQKALDDLASAAAGTNAG